jgi:uncharacterized membrane protein YbhN (UPF0104 family)
MGRSLISWVPCCTTTRCNGRHDEGGGSIQRLAQRPDHRSALVADCHQCAWNRVLVWRFAGQWSALAQEIRGASFAWLFVAWFLYALTLYVLAIRVKVVLGAYQIRHSANRFFALTFIGTFFSSVLPMSVGGDVIKAAHAAQRREDLPEAVLGVLADRGLGFFGIVVLAGIGLWLRSDTDWIGPWPAAAGTLVLATVIVGIAACRWAPIAGWIDLQLGDTGSSIVRLTKRLGRAVMILTRSPPLLSRALILTVVA